MSRSKLRVKVGATVGPNIQAGLNDASSRSSEERRFVFWVAPAYDPQLHPPRSSGARIFGKIHYGPTDWSLPERIERSSASAMSMSANPSAPGVRHGVAFKTQSAK